MFAYCCTGSTVMATRPAITIMIATTAAKIGRSMKKRENMGVGSRRLLRHRDVDAPRLVVAAAAGDFDRRLETDTLGLDACADERVAHRDCAELGEVEVRAERAAAIGVARQVHRRTDPH